MNREESAKGVRGCFLEGFNGDYFFRVYDYEAGTHEDFDIATEEVWVRIESGDLSLWRGKTKKKLGWSSKILGHTQNPGDPAIRPVIMGHKMVKRPDGKPLIVSGTYGEDFEFIPDDPQPE